MGFGGSGFGSVPWGDGGITGPPGGGSPPIPPLPPGVPPVPVTTQDTFRGGGPFQVFSLNDVIDPSRDTLFNQLVVPSGWVASGTGQVTPTSAGIILQSRATVASSASLRAPNADYVFFDAAIEVEQLLPVDDPGGSVEIAALEHLIPGGVCVRVTLRRGGGNNPNDVTAYGEVSNGSNVLASGSVPVPDASGRLTLRLVRSGDAVFGLVGRRNLQTRVYSEVTPVFVGRTGTSTPGCLRIMTRNITTDAVTRTRLHSFTIESHVSINDRLIVDKRITSQEQVFGVVPAAVLAEVGVATVRLFGLFGLAESDTFEYILPPPKTIGTEVVRALRTFVDPILRDDD